MLRLGRFTESDKEVFSDDFDKENKVCLVYEKGPVYFLVSLRSKAIEIHLKAEGRKGKRVLRDACNAVIEDLKTTFPSCSMLIATVSLMSVYNLCIKLGFLDCGLIEDNLPVLMVYKY